MCRKNPTRRSARAFQHRRQQEEVIVVHPDDGPLGRDLRGPVGEALVDGDIGVPPFSAVLRGRDRVVVERPRVAFGEPLVVVLDILRRQRNQNQLQAVVLEGLHLFIGCAVPADPGSLVSVHHRLERGHQATG